jgi:alanine dehydrogenase
MILGIPKEVLENENRVAALPDSVREYVAMGFEVLVEASAGDGALHSDDEYAAAGATIVTDVKSLFDRAITTPKRGCMRPTCSGRDRRWSPSCIRRLRATTR